MVGSIHNYLVRGHQKVIGHYKLLLRSPGLSHSEKQLIEFRLAKEEKELGRLIESVCKEGQRTVVEFARKQSRRANGEAKPGAGVRGGRLLVLVND